MAETALSQIFIEVKNLIADYDKVLVAEKVEATKPQYHLWSYKSIEAFGRKRDKIYFAGVIQQKSFVGFYFMPVYAEPAKLKKFFSPKLLTLLKGKSCFHLKRLDADLLADIKHALEVGFKEYQTKGWV
ncbi:MAG: DUF1801 domain-containing protein [Candidatus Pacebacteria bacterium]|nr:DUF1801 domain-containing protein [Candidatus Paceibacterota bacterium]